MTRDIRKESAAPLRLLAAAAAVALFAGAARPALADEFAVLHSFDPAAGEGAGPLAPPTANGPVDGGLYGATQGTLYRIVPGGAFTVLSTIKLPKYGQIDTPEVLGSDLKLHGLVHSTLGSRCTGYYVTDTVGSFKSGYDNSLACLTPSIAASTTGAVFGVDDYANFFRLNANDTETVVHATDMQQPYPTPASNLVGAVDGKLYYLAELFDPSTITWQGMTLATYKQNGTLSTSALLPDADVGSNISMMQGSDGKLWGVGLFSDKAKFFKLSLKGTLAFVHTFTGADAGFPGDSVRAVGIVQGADGNFRVSLQATPASRKVQPEGGAVVEVAADGTVTMLHQFTGGAGGGAPNALTVGADGRLYGTTATGGTTGYGTIFGMPMN